MYINTLVLGGGSREHVLVDKIGQSPLTGTVLCAPGNAGIARKFRRKVRLDDFPAILKLVQEENIQLLVPGPEAPLVAGIVDFFATKAPEVMVFGPSKHAAELEGDKIFTKTRCKRWGIPTANFDFAGDIKVAIRSINRHGWRVIKAAGLCGGKGVVVADTEEEAIEAARQMLVGCIHGAAGRQIVMEERLVGREASFMVFCDGENYYVMPVAADHKRAYDGDQGPNTGGMGAYSPVPYVDKAMMKRIMREIIEPTVRGMRESGRPFKGVLYAGLMITTEGPKLIEYNVRFGDPEVQVVLPGLLSDFVRVMLSCINPTQYPWSKKGLRWDNLARVGVVLTTKEYPAAAKPGHFILGLEEAAKVAKVYHGGTEELDGFVFTNGGRLATFVGEGADLADARREAMWGIHRVSCPETRFRSDIGLNVPQSIE